MKPIHIILIITPILILCFTLVTKGIGILENNPLGSIFLIFLSLIAMNKYKTSWKVLTKQSNIYKPYPFNENTNKRLNDFRGINFKPLFPFIPLVIVTILILIKPYYLLPTLGDLDYHLMRAREIIENPFYGMFYDYMVNYPIGRPIGHPPIFHSIFATLWYIGGVRFADALMSISQILLSIGIATWFANKKFGPLAGFFAGIFVLASPRIDTLFVPMPATFIPILGVLTIYFMPHDDKKTIISSLLGIWTHMLGIVLFPMILISNKKGREYLKNWKFAIPIFVSVVFWLGYWTYFTGKPGPSSIPSICLYDHTYLLGLIVLLVFGISGLIILFNEKKIEFKMFFTYLLTVLILQIIIADVSRGLQYATLPLAILAGLFVQKTYQYLKKYKYSLKHLFLILMLFMGFLSSMQFICSPLIESSDWNNLNIPFENKYNNLKNYIEFNTNKNEILGADTYTAYKIIWMTGRKVFNNELGPSNKFNNNPQIHISQDSDYFSIKDKNNITYNQISFINQNWNQNNEY